jgi:aminoglycoside 3-N-acetyltransferase
MLNTQFTALAKSKLKAFKKRAHAAVVQLFYSYTPSQFAEALEKLGIKKGDHLMLHSAFGSRFGFHGSAEELINILLKAVGPTGGLYMVSLPYSTSTAAHLAANPVFDVRRTPSKMGLVSEFFRRRPDVLRSLHPSHPILGLGPQAQHVLAGHAGNPHGCGAGSPFERLLELDAKIVFYNVSLDYMTYFHYLEHVVAEYLPFPLYDTKPITARAIDWQGQARDFDVYAYSDEVMRKRQPEKLHKWLREAGLISEVKIGATTLLAVNMRQITDLTLNKVRAGQCFHDVAK